MSDKAKPLAIRPRGEICTYVTVLTLAGVTALVMSIVIVHISNNHLQSIVEQRNERLKVFLVYLDHLNKTIISAPTPNPLTSGVFVESGTEIIVNRGAGTNKVPSTVDYFEVGKVNLTTTGDVLTSEGIFRISGDKVIDCCALAEEECDAVWQASEFTPQCCGNMVQLNATVACGLNLSPEQVLHVSNVVPSAPSGETSADSTTNTLLMNHTATVMSGRLSYDGGRQIPITLGEYVIALNTSRKWTLAEVAPCGYPLQGTKNLNPCVFGGVQYPVDIISVYQGVSDSCQNHRLDVASFTKKPSMSLTGDNPGTAGSFVYDKPLTQLADAQMETSVNPTAPSGGAWNGCNSNTFISPNPWASQFCSVDSNGHPLADCPISSLTNVLTACGSLRNPSNTFYGSGSGCPLENPISGQPNQIYASNIFDPRYTYATTPKFDLVDGAVYEVRFGGTAMNFRPLTTKFKNPGASTDGVCATFNVVTITNDACGIDGCDFYLPVPNTQNCTISLNSTTSSNTTTNTMFSCSDSVQDPYLRLSYSSASMAFQLFVLCLAVPADETLVGYNAAVFERIDGNVPYVYDYSLNPQTHQMDGRMLYLINTTKITEWANDGTTPAYTVDQMKGQCGLFLSGTPMMITNQQQDKFRTVKTSPGEDVQPCTTIPNDPAYTVNGVNNCPPFSYSTNGYENPSPPSGTSGIMNRPDLYAPMGFNHFCQTSNFTMFNTYVEVTTELPGFTETLEPMPTPSCTPTPAPSMKRSAKRIKITDEGEP